MKTVRVSYLPTIGDEMERDAIHEVRRYLKQRRILNAFTLFRVRGLIDGSVVGNIVAVPKRSARRFEQDTAGVSRI